MEDHSLGKGKQIDASSVPKEVTQLVSTLSEKQLMNLRHHLDMLLQIEINQLNLTEELGLQYRQGKILLDSLDDKTPANQRAQVFNSVQAQLEKIIKQRAAVFNQERLKHYEGALLKVLDMQGNEKAKELFLELYGAHLRNRGQ